VLAVQSLEAAQQKKATASNLMSAALAIRFIQARKSRSKQAEGLASLINAGQRSSFLRCLKKGLNELSNKNHILKWLF